MARPGGELQRAGHTHAGCDLAALSGLEPSSVICEVLNEDGTMARLPELVEFGRRHGLKIGTIADLIHYRAKSETLIERVAAKPVSTAHGDFMLHAFVDRVGDTTHLALTKGEIRPDVETLVRVHEPLSVLDFLDPGSRRAAFTLDQAQAALAKHGHGVIVLLHRPETGADLLARLTAEPDSERPRPKWDPRIYGIGAQILKGLGVGRMKLLASPRKMPSMAGFDLEVTGYAATPDEL
jgi:3,4-dihydroxy 2-butanone 4-phosphate synthase/GTP cyclohydrolase II